MIRLAWGKKVVEDDGTALRSRLRDVETVHLDLGCGDGGFAYHLAKQNPRTLVIGIDSAAEPLEKFSHKTCRKPAKGGLPNALFVIARVEDPPQPLHGLAHSLTINYPWGSLLHGLVCAEPPFLRAIHALARPGAELDALINYHVLTDAALSATLDLPEISPAWVNDVLAPAWAGEGWTVTHHSLHTADAPPRHTTWGMRLVKGSGRPTLRIRARRGDD